MPERDRRPFDRATLALAGGHCNVAVWTGAFEPRGLPHRGTGRISGSAMFAAAQWHPPGAALSISCTGWSIPGPFRHLRHFLSTDTHAGRHGASASEPAHNDRAPPPADAPLPIHRLKGNSSMNETTSLMATTEFDATAALDDLLADVGLSVADPGGG